VGYGKYKIIRYRTIIVTVDVPVQCPEAGVFAWHRYNGYNYGVTDIVTRALYVAGVKLLGGEQLYEL
jgi:hypothetical protein